MTEENRRHKILFIECGSGRGGSSMALFYTLKCLDMSKFQPVVIFYFLNNGPDTDMIRGLGVPTLFLSDKSGPLDHKPLRWLSGKTKSKTAHKIKIIARFLIEILLVEIPFIWRLHKLIKKEAMGLLVLNNDVHYHIAGTIAAIMAGIPCICIKAGGIGEGRRIKRFLTPYVDLFIAISKATSEDQVINSPSTRRVVTIHRGIDMRMYDLTLSGHGKKEELGIPSHKKVVGNVSRFDRGKGQIQLLEAAGSVVKTFKDVIFLMVGDGELMKELQSKAKDLNLAEHVIFTGWRTDIPAILSAMDIFVHCPTTWIEGLGIANLEAMAMGKPTVVSNNGGLPEAVADGITGYVVAPQDIGQLSEAILKLLVEQELALQFGENARKRVEEEFDMAKNVRKFEGIFMEFLT